jgi:hypothetical protein
MCEVSKRYEKITNILKTMKYAYIGKLIDVADDMVFHQSQDFIDL